MTQQRLLGADFLRAAACMMVMLHHLAFRMPADKVPALFRGLHGFLLMGSFGVSVFFMLSGFLLSQPFWLALDRGEAMPSLRIYALRRAARILPGFWLALLVSLLVGVALGGSPLSAEQAIRFLAGFLLVSDWHWMTLFPVDNNGPLWSIGFEATSYVLLPLCLLLLFALRLQGWAARIFWIAVIGLVLCLHSMVVRWAPIDEIGRGWEYGLLGGAKAWMPRFNPFGFFAIFALGALAGGIQVALSNIRHWLLDVLGLSALLATVFSMALLMGGETEGYGWLGIPYAFPWLPLFVGAALVALPSSMVVGRLLDNPVSRFVAAIPFGIYVWHFLLIELLADLVPPVFDTSGDAVWAVWLWSSAAAMGLSFILATASFYFLERPVVRWARTLEGRQKSLEAAPASA